MSTWRGRNSCVARMFVWFEVALATSRSLEGSDRCALHTLQTTWVRFLTVLSGIVRSAASKWPPCSISAVTERKWSPVPSLTRTRKDWGSLGIAVRLYKWNAKILLLQLFSYKYLYGELTNWCQFSAKRLVDPHLFDNFMTRFMINKRTDT